MNKRRNGNFALYILHGELIVLRTGLSMYVREWILYYNNESFSDFAYESFSWPSLSRRKRLSQISRVRTEILPSCRWTHLQSSGSSRKDAETKRAFKLLSK